MKALFQNFTAKKRYSLVTAIIIIVVASWYRLEILSFFILLFSGNLDPNKDKIYFDIDYLVPVYHEFDALSGAYQMRYSVMGTVDDSVKLNGVCCLIGEIDYQSDVIEVDENKPVVTVFDPLNAELGSLEIEYVFDLKEEKE